MSMSVFKISQTKQLLEQNSMFPVVSSAQQRFQEQLDHQWTEFNNFKTIKHIHQSSYWNDLGIVKWNSSRIQKEEPEYGNL